jgi:hypothetical protein
LGEISEAYWGLNWGRFLICQEDVTKSHLFESVSSIFYERGKGFIRRFACEHFYIESVLEGREWKCRKCGLMKAKNKGWLDEPAESSEELLGKLFMECSTK